MSRLLILVYFIFLPPLISNAQYQEQIPKTVKFEQITASQGLSQSCINCIFEDSYGFMWFGSNLGLKKFDGYRFTRYQHNPEDAHSLSDNEVRSISEDNTGSLWIGTRYGGLNRYDRETDSWAMEKLKTRPDTDPDTRF